VAKKSKPRGHRHSYTPCWTKECETLLSEYKKVGAEREVNANQLVGLLVEKQRNRWQKAPDNLDFTHSSRESWSLLRKLGPFSLHIQRIKHRRTRSQTSYSKPQI